MVSLPVNLGFENGDENQFPAYWIYNDMKDNDDNAFLIRSDNTEGIYSLRIENPAEGNLPDTTGFGYLYQSIDALQYRGKYIRFSADIKTQFKTPYGAGYLLLVVKDERGEVIYANDYLDNPIKIRQWETYAIDTYIPYDASEIRIGIGFKAGGYLLADNLRFDAVNYQTEIWQPQEINENYLQNLYALAKVYSTVKFYHPSTISEFAPWDVFMVNAVRELRDINNNDSLRAKLEELFTPIAPTIRFSESKDIALNYKKPTTDIADAALYFYHKAGYSARPTNNYASTIENAFIPTRGREAAVMQFIDISEYRGKSIKVSVDIFTEDFTPATQAQLWLRGDREEKKIAFMLQSDSKINQNGVWITHELEADIPEDATILRIGLVLYGDGIAYYDNVRMKSGDTEYEVKNSDFEMKAKIGTVPSWRIPETVAQAGYLLEVSDERKSKGSSSLKIFTDPNTTINTPMPGEIYSEQIFDDLYFALPICLWADSINTFPIADKKMVFNRIRPDFVLNADDFSSRISIAIMAWARLAQFNINDLSKNSLDSLLATTLQKAALNKGKNEFLTTMNEMLSIVNDPLAGVWYNFDEEIFVLPILWKFFEGKLIITKIFDSDFDISAGDEVISIDGLPSIDYLRHTKARISKKSGDLSTAKALGLIRTGDFGSELYLKIRNKDNAEKEIVIKKNTHAFDAVEKRPKKLFMLEKGIYYVDITRISNKEFQDMMPVLQGAEKIVFDARGKAGTSIHFLGFLRDEPFPGAMWQVRYHTKPYHGNNNMNTISGNIGLEGILKDKKVVFLADERSSGYSEPILATVKHNKLGTIIGKATEGSYGEMIQWILPGFYIMNVPIIKSYAPDGTQIGGNGVKPDILINYKVEDLLNDEDTLIKAALKFLK